MIRTRRMVFPRSDAARARVLGEHAGGIRRGEAARVLSMSPTRRPARRLRGVVQRRGQGPEVLRAHVRGRRDEHAQGGGVGARHAQLRGEAPRHMPPMLTGEPAGWSAAMHAACPPAAARSGWGTRSVVARDEEIEHVVARPDRRRSIGRREFLDTRSSFSADSDPPEPGAATCATDSPRMVRASNSAPYARSASKISK